MPFVTLASLPAKNIFPGIAGRVEFTVGAETRIMEPGVSAIIPGGTPHGCRALTACRVLDIFSPARDDYR